MEITVPPDNHIQDDGTVLFLEQTLNHSGKWRVHMNDPDDSWPSDFHAHNVEDAREKLDLYTGKVYNTNTKQCICQLKAKVMRYMHNELVNSNNKVIAGKAAVDKAKFPFLP